MATLCWYGEASQARYVANAISQFAELYTDSLMWRLCPTLFLIYAAGIAAVHHQNWRYLPLILTQPRLIPRRSGQGQYSSAVAVITDEFIPSFLEYAGLDRPFLLSQYLQEQLRPIFEPLIISDTNYCNTFDLFEMLLSLVYLILSGKNDWMPLHLAIADRRSRSYLSEFWSSNKPGLLREAGLFGEAEGRLKEVLVTYSTVAQRISPYYGNLNLDYAALYSGAKAK
jgi:hypothetical protein